MSRAKRLLEHWADKKGRARAREKRRRKNGLEVREVRTENIVVWLAVSRFPLKGPCVLVWPCGVFDDIDQHAREAAMSRFVDQAKKRMATQDSAVAALDEEFARRYPAINEFITLRRCDDGTARTPATLLLLAEDGVFKVCLNDRQEAASTWASAPSVDEAMEALEGLLATGEAVWRASGQGRPTKRPR